MVFNPRNNFIVVYTLLVWLALPINNNAQSIIFNNFTTQHGLTNNDVNTLIQDSFGFIWFGTEDGLNRFDGYNFKVFRHNPIDHNTLTDNAIWALLEDKNGFIWIGTKNGFLNKFDPISETFNSWNFNRSGQSNNSVTALFEDSKGIIWIGTRTTGIHSIDPVSNEIQNWNKTTDNLKVSLSNQSVRAIAEDSFGNIIIGTYNGLNKFHPKKPFTGFEKFFHDEYDSNSLFHNQIYNISKSKSDFNSFWIGGPAGLTEFNSANNSFTRIKIPNPENLQFGSGASTVIDEFAGTDRILWIDTYSGLIRLNLNSGEHNRYINDDLDPNSLISNQINKMIKDQSGVLWLATENGISSYSPKSSKFNSRLNNNLNLFLQAVNKRKNLKSIIQNSKGFLRFGFENGLVSTDENGNLISNLFGNKLNNFNIWSLAETDNSLWIGTYGQGLKKLDLTSGLIEDWSLKNHLQNTIAVPFVRYLYKDSKNNLWVGYWGSGLARIDLSNGNYLIWNKITADTVSLSSSDVWCITEDRFGRIWIGTIGGGLNLFVNDNGLFKKWSQTTVADSSLNSNDIYSVLENKNFNSNDDFETLLWIGTSNGLNKVIIKHDSSNLFEPELIISSYGIEDGLNDISVQSIVQDDYGNLWLGTGSGISFFDTKKEYFLNFSAADGLMGTSMNSQAAIQSRNGLMFFGSSKGLNVFSPYEFKLSDYKPSIVFTDFQIFNKSVVVGDKSPLKQSIIALKEITLKPDFSVFSIEFSALDYNAPGSINYSYKMDGFDEIWTNSGNRNFATYTNLDPGTYFFRVKSTNADGLWNGNETSLKIVISPPWWATLWAYGLYIVLIIIGLLVIRRFEINRAKLRNELRLKDFEAKKKSELEQLKSRFFANLSHEFRTPLMLIKGPLENLKKNGKDSNNLSDIELIERNSKNLEQLINELLELSQLESASIPLKAKKENLVTLLKGIVSSFDSIAVQKKIQLNFISFSDSLILWIDRDKFEKIINNLLSNAFKFTPSNGKIEVKTTKLNFKEKEYAEISVRDTGIGISEDKLSNIFDRFYQVDDSSQRSFGGSGIGLALVKEFVDLHKWEISVESKVGEGTTFFLRIPVSEDFLNENEKMISDDIENDEVNFILSQTENLHSNKMDVISDLSEKTKNVYPVILIVDDSDDVRKYLKGLLKTKYNIFEASNGFEGIKTALKISPDLIISDIMMPSMDGLEFCQKLRTDWKTSDIPIILLSAKASFESKLEGLEIGADDYLTKPFESRELFIRIRNLLDQRTRIREKFIKTNSKYPVTDQLSVAEHDFIKRAYKIVESNLDKTSFNTDQLAKELFLSRSQLHRKFSDIIGQSPGEFIRIIKLNHAASMLLEKKLSVTQIAYAIGFSSPAQFSRAFSKQFNCTPTDYLSNKKHQKEN